MNRSNCHVSYKYFVHVSLLHIFQEGIMCLIEPLNSRITAPNYFLNNLQTGKYFCHKFNFIVSSPEHIVLMVSYCYTMMSIVNPSIHKLFH